MTDDAGILTEIFLCDLLTDNEPVPQVRYKKADFYIYHLPNEEDNDNQQA